MCKAKKVWNGMHFLMSNATIMNTIWKITSLHFLGILFLKACFLFEGECLNCCLQLCELIELNDLENLNLYYNFGVKTLYES